MKKIMFSALAVGCAIVGVTATKANTSRLSHIFHFNKALSVAPTAATLTNASNWSTVSVSPSCVGSIVPCGVSPQQGDNILTKTDLTAAIRANGGAIPSDYTVTTKAKNVQ